MSTVQIGYHERSVMAKNKISIIYFSATDVTRSYAQVLKDEILTMGWDVKCIDITSYGSRQGKMLTKDDQNIIFGFPVYGDLAPCVINDWICTLDGSGKKCAMFFTFGGRTSGYAHFHTKLLLDKAGFRVLFSAEFLGRHSFNQGGWSILEDRPDQADFEVARDFALLATDRFSMPNPPAFHLQKPFGYGYAIKAKENKGKQTKRSLAHPTRVTEECIMCRLCEDECPTLAFDADTGLSDIETCIECMRCVYICPEGVIHCDPKMKEDFQLFLDYFHLNDAMLNAKQSKIITESWQAAA